MDTTNIKPKDEINNTTTATAATTTTGNMDNNMNQEIVVDKVFDTTGTVNDRNKDYSKVVNRNNQDRLITDEQYRVSLNDEVLVSTSGEESSSFNSTDDEKEKKLGTTCDNNDRLNFEVKQRHDDVDSATRFHQNKNKDTAFVSVVSTSLTTKTVAASARIDVNAVSTNDSTTGFVVQHYDNPVTETEKEFSISIYDNKTKDTLTDDDHDEEFHTIGSAKTQSNLVEKVKDTAFMSVPPSVTKVNVDLGMALLNKDNNIEFVQDDVAKETEKPSTLTDDDDDDDDKKPRALTGDKDRSSFEGLHAIEFGTRSELENGKDTAFVSLPPSVTKAHVDLDMVSLNYNNIEPVQDDVIKEKEKPFSNPTDDDDNKKPQAFKGIDVRSSFEKYHAAIESGTQSNLGNGKDTAFVSLPPQLVTKESLVATIDSKNSTTTTCTGNSTNSDIMSQEIVVDKYKVFGTGYEDKNIDRPRENIKDKPAAEHDQVSLQDEVMVSCTADNSSSISTDNDKKLSTVDNDCSSVEVEFHDKVESATRFNLGKHKDTAFVPAPTSLTKESEAAMDVSTISINENSITGFMVEHYDAVKETEKHFSTSINDDRKQTFTDDDRSSYEEYHVIESTKTRSNLGKVQDTASVSLPPSVLKANVDIGVASLNNNSNETVQDDVVAKPFSTPTTNNDKKPPTLTGNDRSSSEEFHVAIDSGIRSNIGNGKDATFVSLAPPSVTTETLVVAMRKENSSTFCVAEHDVEKHTDDDKKQRVFTNDKRCNFEEFQTIKPVTPCFLGKDKDTAFMSIPPSVTKDSVVAVDVGKVSINENRTGCVQHDVVEKVEKPFSTLTDDGKEQRAVPDKQSRFEELHAIESPTPSNLGNGNDTAVVSPSTATTTETVAALMDVGVASLDESSKGIERLIKETEKPLSTCTDNYEKPRDFTNDDDCSDFEESHETESATRYKLCNNTTSVSLPPSATTETVAAVNIGVASINKNYTGSEQHVEVKESEKLLSNSTDDNNKEARAFTDDDLLCCEELRAVVADKNAKKNELLEYNDDSDENESVYEVKEIRDARINPETNQKELLVYWGDEWPDEWKALDYFYFDANAEFEQILKKKLQDENSDPCNYKKLLDVRINKETNQREFLVHWGKERIDSWEPECDFFKPISVNEIDRLMNKKLKLERVAKSTTGTCKQVAKRKSEHVLHRQSKKKKLVKKESSVTKLLPQKNSKQQASAKKPIMKNTSKSSLVKKRNMGTKISTARKKSAKKEITIQKTRPSSVEHRQSKTDLPEASVELGNGSGINCISLETPANSFATHYFGSSRLLMRRFPFKPNLPVTPESTFSLHNELYDMLCCHISSKSGSNNFTHGPQDNKEMMEYIYIKRGKMSLVKELEEIADFASLPPEKAKSRLELLVSGTNSGIVLNTLKPSQFRNVAENYHQGCAFYPEEMRDLFDGGPSGRQNLSHVFVARIFIPSKGIYKGLLFPKPGINCIELPSSMRKVPPSKSKTHRATAQKKISEAIVIIKNKFPTENNYHLGQMLKGLPYNKNVFLGRKKKGVYKVEPGDMMYRLWQSLDVPPVEIEKYKKRCISKVENMKHSYFVGAADPFGTLPQNTIFVSGLSENHIDSSLNRNVFITRSPCNEPSDGRIIKLALSKPKRMFKAHWEWLNSLPFGMVVFGPPLPGMEPLPTQIAGGDLDGDTYFICWDPIIVKHVKPVPIYKIPESWCNVVMNKNFNTKSKNWLSASQERMSDIDSAYAIQKLTCKLYSLNVEIADENDKFMKDKLAIQIAKAYKHVLDMSKHGGRLLVPACIGEKIAKFPKNVRTVVEIQDD